MAIWVAAIAAIGGSLAVLFLIHSNRTRVITLKGAVIRQDTDPDKELPIANVKITVANGLTASYGQSDSSGFFSLTLPKGSRPGRPVVLQFRHPDYHPLNLNVLADDKLYVARMVPVRQQRDVNHQGPQKVVSNIVVRYSVKTITAVNVGSEVKSFQVVNTSNVPCNGREPCSPDGKWKAAIGSTSLDAGEGNVFHNVRVSCIAGPCPFTMIKPYDFSQAGRIISVTALDWSDTATFLLEAEVFHPMVSDRVRHSYPVIFGRALNFTVPPSAEGVCIEAEIDGTSIIFPLGPDPVLRWATCNARVNPSQTRVYRCELEPGYRF